MEQILISGALLFLVAFICAIALVYLHGKFDVETDDTVEKVSSLLSGANCGACGRPGCNNFAEALIEGRASVDFCPQIKSKKQEILDLLEKKDK